MHPRNFGSGQSSARSTYVRPPLHESRDEILHFEHPRVSAVNRIAFRTQEIKATTTKPILCFELILMSTLTWITEKELEREIKNKGDQFRWNKNKKIL